MPCICTDQNRLLNEAITLMEHLDPRNEVNTVDQVKAAIRQYKARQNIYSDRINEMLDELVALKESIKARQAADAATQQAGQAAPQGPRGQDLAPRFQARDGAPGKLSDAIDPAGLARWLSSYEDWMAASYGGQPPTDSQMLTQAMLL